MAKAPTKKAPAKAPTKAAPIPTTASGTASQVAALVAKGMNPAFAAAIVKGRAKKGKKKKTTASAVPAAK